MNFIDSFLNQITMYRLLLYYLIVLVVMAVGFSFLNILPFDPVMLVISTLFLVAVCWVTNTIFAKTFGAPTNIESVYISALILALIISPLKSFDGLVFLFWAGVWAMASKYMLAINKKHVFNPVAFAVLLTSYTIAQSATWWVGTASMLPVVLIGGVLIVRKIRRFDLVFYFFIASLITILGLSFFKGSDPVTTLRKTFLDSPILFFAFVMLSEPLTTPPTKLLQSIYGSIVGVLFSPQINISGFTTTPELALIIGNIYSYLVSPKIKLILTLKEKIQVAPDIYDFVFGINQKLAFNPGQYMEWTLAHHMPDSRGNRRYFTVASSPTEPDLRIGVKFYPNPSSFKKKLGSLGEKDPVVVSSLAGDFTLPKDPSKKLVFIAGGIGVTPFRSIIKYLLDINQKRDIVLLYSNKAALDIVYSQIFQDAYQKLGIKTVYTLSDLEKVPQNWSGKIGPITPEMITQEIPDYKDRIFYLSGPHGMVAAFEQTLSKMGLPKSQVKTDFFPGFV